MAAWRWWAAGGVGLALVAGFGGALATLATRALPRECTHNPQILVYHTHGSEGYEDGSILQVGRALALALCERGYRVQHLTAVFDQPDPGPAYHRARAVLEPLLVARPAVQVLVDVHRDAPGRRQTTGTLEGRPAVRMLLVVGRESRHFEAADRLARAFIRELVRRQSDLNRGIRYKNGVYNQDLRPLSLLVEFGGLSNTLEEALRSVPVAAAVLAAALEAVAGDAP